MPNIGPAQILLVLLTFCLMAVLASMFMAWGWLILRLLNRLPIFPVQPMVSRQDPTWGGWSVLLIVFLYAVVGFSITHGYALVTHRGPRRQAPPQVVKKDLPTVEPEKQLNGKVIEPTFAMTETMFVNSVAQVIMLVLVPLVLRLTSGARLRDLGLSWSGWWRQAAVGLVAMLIATPIVYLVQFGAISVWRPNSHPLEKMLREQFSIDVGYLALVAGVILAPMLEEMTFRGVLQSWLTKWMSRRQHMIEPPDIPLEPAGPEGEGNFPSAAAEYWETLDRADDLVGDPAPKKAADFPGAAVKAIVITSLFFAAVHGAQWPAPIPIFVLSLVLGTVYYRTGSLIASICVHGAFNGMSTLVMFVALLAGPEVDKNKALPEAMHALNLRCDGGKQPCIHVSKSRMPF
jgi:membrane protease YdiL (CAAX protease family)